MICYYCNSNNCKVIAGQETIRFNCYNSSKDMIECLDCGIVQIFPQWKKNELEKIYKNYSNTPDFNGQKDIGKRMTKYLKKYFKKEHKILEIGCGRGDNIKYYKSLGYNIVGIDIDKSIKYDNNIICSDYKDFLKKDDKWDMIYTLHFLEHEKDTVKFLKLILSRLKEGGIYLSELPNLYNSLIYLYKIKEFKNFYWRPDHVVTYTPETLENILRQFNNIEYSIKRRQMYGFLNHINWFIRKKPTNVKIFIPIIDNIYNFILHNIFKKSDTLLLIIKKKGEKRRK